MATAPENTKQVTLASLKPQADALPTTTMGFANLQSFELMQRAAKLLASSTLVPQDYRANLANCVIALNMAQRLGADPLMVMQNLYVVHGRPGWSAQFLIACFNQCGRFSALRYRWAGTEGKDDWSCQAYATERETGDVITGPAISLALAKKEGWYEKKGSKWQTLPQLMLMYRAAAWLVRTHAPEISMGLQTAEELGDVFDASKGADGQYAVTLDTLRDGQAAEPAQADGDAPALVLDGTPPDHDADAIARLESAYAKGSKQLSAAWVSVCADYATRGADLPLPLEAKFRELTEAAS